MKLNGTSGLEVLRVLKDRNPQALVMQMSGHSEMHEEMAQGLRMSASASFTKPFDIEELTSSLRHAMSGGGKSA